MRHTLAVLAALMASGCTTATAPPEGSASAKEKPFPSGVAQQVDPGGVSAAYPSTADWGVSLNQVVPNWGFVGVADSINKPVTKNGYQLVSLADFYNPQGYEYEACVKSNATDCDAKFPSAVFPVGSPWAGQAKPRALSLGMSAGWCPPCQEEAKNVLPKKYDQYKPKGGHFLNTLTDGWTKGKTATFADIKKWTTLYKVAYSMMTDPADQLPQLFPPLLPSNGIIRTSDMRILFVIAGAPQDLSFCDNESGAQKTACLKSDNVQYWLKFEQALASPN